MFSFFILVGLVVVIGLLLSVFGGNLFSKKKYPYIRRDNLLTNMEIGFLDVLDEAIGNRYRVFAQVRMADLLRVRKTVISRKDKWQWQNKINSKHIDFVVCEKGNLKILCLIELDDSSHQKSERKRRDYFVNKACKDAKLPLLRVPAKQRFSAKELKKQIDDAIKGLEPITTLDEAENGANITSPPRNS